MFGYKSEKSVQKKEIIHAVCEREPKKMEGNVYT